MNVIRFPNGNSGDNCNALSALINDVHCKEVRLFTTPALIDSQYNYDTDGAENNLPLLAAWAKYEIPQVTTLYVLFDGLFLTAARKPRYLEVQAVLDAAEKSDKVTFATVRASFTSALTPEKAVDMLNAIPFAEFTPSNRAKYFQMMSNLTENDFLTL